MKPRLFIEQKITAFTNQYKVYESGKKGEQADMIAFAQQKRLAFKEKVEFYGGEQKTAVVYSFRAEKVLDVHGRYLVEGAEGQLLGMFRKDFKQSLLNSTWIVMDASGNDLFKVNESSAVLAFLRRFAGWLPFIGELIEIATSFLKYHFFFTSIDSREAIGKYQKTTLFRDHYTLHMTDEAYTSCDWRVLAAMGVALDALQSR